MPSPFPGMDPYLETPDPWPDGHHGVISEIRSALNRAICPRYVARVTELTYPSTGPLKADRLAEAAHVEIQHRESQSLVTVIEVLCPTNKAHGWRGRPSYKEK